MTVLVNVGRRVPKKWYRRVGSKVKGLITFQENIWQIICDSFNNAKKSAQKDGRIEFKIIKDLEPEDLHYNIEWRKIIIRGSPKMEQEEYDDAMGMYDKLSNKMKKDFDTDENMSKRLKSKVLSPDKIKNAYEKGYGAVNQKSIANKLLEMGIMTHVEKIDDYESRDDQYLYS